jgi:hypothetical protein
MKSCRPSIRWTSPVRINGYRVTIADECGRLIRNLNTKSSQCGPDLPGRGAQRIGSGPLARPALWS